MPDGFPVKPCAALLSCVLALSQLGCEEQGAPRAGAERQRCALDKSQSPEVRGFRLGMGLDQIRQRFPGLRVGEADELGARRIVLEGSKGLPPERNVSGSPARESNLVNTSRLPEFADVNLVELGLLDDRVTLIDVTYTDGHKWGAYDVFAAQVAKSLNLPGGKEWRHSQGAAALDCVGFSVLAGFRVRTLNRETADVRTYPFVVVNDNEADKAVSDRKRARLAREEEKLKEFKP